MVGIGIIGCGARVRAVVRNIRSCTDSIEVVALCDPSEDSIQESHKVLECSDAKIYDDYEMLVADTDVQWVFIGSFNCCHRDHAIAAIEAGKSVFCEKPLATNIDDALDILKSHQKSTKQFVVGFTLRYTKHYRKLKKLISEGLIGEIVSMEFNETLEFNHGGYIHQDWRRYQKLAGTHLLEKCCHDLDAMNWILNDARPRRVASFGGLNFFKSDNAHHADRIGPNPIDGRVAFRGWSSNLGPIDSPFIDNKDIVDNQVVIIEYDNDVRATFHTNCMAAQHERRCYIVGSEGSIRADFVSGRIELKRVGWDEPTTIYNTSVIGGHGGGDMILAQELNKCMNNNNNTHLPTGIKEGLISAVTAFGVDKAMETGQVVDMKPFWEKIDNVKKNISSQEK